jgi:hypothetical protein
MVVYSFVKYSIKSLYLKNLARISYTSNVNQLELEDMGNFQSSEIGKAHNRNPYLADIALTVILAEHLKSLTLTSY